MYDFLDFGVHGKNFEWGKTFATISRSFTNYNNWLRINRNQLRTSWTYQDSTTNPTIYQFVVILGIRVPCGMGVLTTTTNSKSYYNSSSVCTFVCSPTPPRSFDGSSPNLVGVCRWTSELPLRGSFLKRSTGQRVKRHFFHTIIRAVFVRLFVLLLLWGPLTDLRQTWWVYVGGPRNCPWGVLFWKGQRVNGSNVTFSEQTTPGWDHTAAKGVPSKRHTASKSLIPSTGIFTSLIKISKE